MLNFRIGCSIFKLVQFFWFKNIVLYQLHKEISMATQMINTTNIKGTLEQGRANGLKY